MGTRRSLSTRISRSTPLRYSVSIAAVVIAGLVCVLVNPFAAKGVAYVLLFPAVAFSAWYCGIGPTIIAVVLSVVGAMYGFVPHVHHFATPDGTAIVGAIAFLLSSAIVLIMGEARRRQNEILRKAQWELEQTVTERTADLDAVNQNLRDLSGRLLQMQDDERRRIARELHDSVGQMLAALSMNLSSVQSEMERLTKTAAILIDSESLVQQMSTEVRTISHLLHPPLLDEAGLSSALRWYVDGFAQRSGIKVELDMPDNFGRLPSDLETAVFRVAQECLTNIHRHSGSAVAKIRVRQRDEQLWLDIEDKGRGIPQHKLEEMASTGTPGVGIRGMQERLRQLDGKLAIESNQNGTSVRVRLPMAENLDRTPVDVTNPSSSAAA